MDDDDIVPFGKRNQALVKRHVRHRSRGVIRIGYHNCARFIGHRRVDCVKIHEIAVFLTQRHKADFRPGHHRPKGKDRVSRVGREYQIPRPDQRERDMCDALLRAAYAHHFIPLERHAVAPRIPVPDRFLQGGRITQGIFIVLRPQRRFADRLQHMLVGCKVGRTDGKVDHVAAGGKDFALFFVQPVEDIGGHFLPPPHKFHTFTSAFIVV